MKSKGNANYNKKIQQAKENLLAEKYQQIETLQEKHDDFNLHKVLMEIALNHIDVKKVYVCVV